MTSVFMPLIHMLPAPEHILEKARLARDPRFDGRFFVGVLSTGVYCRPVCRVRMPAAENVRFYASAAAAMDAGFRPCLRCRPEAAPGTPAWGGTSATVSRGLRLIQEGAMDDGDVASLADRLGVTDRHLRRLFLQHVGVTPLRVAETRRLLLAKQMLTETSLRMTDIAMAAGYGSVRSFNAHIRRVFGRTPTELRGRHASGGGHPGSGLVLTLGYREPFDWAGLLAFIERRATPGVEMVLGSEYKRSVRVGGSTGLLTVGPAVDQPALVCRLDLSAAAPLLAVVATIRRMFDLEADPVAIVSALGRDPDIGALVRENPGQRLPGAWDPFEAAVRAIVGQQVSVAGATTVMGRIVAQYGEDLPDPGDDGPARLFPTPAALAELDDAHMPMPRVRAGAIRELATRIANGAIRLDAATAPEVLREQLTQIKGIGPWTAQYVTMRALADPDAFLASDLILMRIARERFGDPSAAALEARAESWRPWRAYAGLHMWRSQ